MIIKSISFLSAPSERTHITSSRGKFVLSRKRSALSKGYSRSFTASEFVDFVRNRDPFITLESGNKLRVYRGGDPTDEVIETICVVERHDELLKVEEEQIDFDDFYDW
tara:strand:- start:862 stop:1185 length:324 start_codon:yes stop_codon:yes gene_type:complete